MRYILQGLRNTSQRHAVDLPLNLTTTLMAVAVVLWLSVGAILVLTGVLAYAVFYAAVRGLILLFAAGTLGCCWLLYQAVRVTTRLRGG